MIRNSDGTAASSFISHGSRSTSQSLSLNLFSNLPQATLFCRQCSDTIIFQTQNAGFRLWVRKLHRLASLFLSSLFLSPAQALLSLILTLKSFWLCSSPLPQMRALRRHPNWVSSLWIFKHSTHHLEITIPLPSSFQTSTQISLLWGLVLFCVLSKYCPISFYGAFSQDFCIISTFHWQNYN